MLIGFIGAPCSGKTTMAAKIFAHLKENGSTCELISEQARFYIAEKRYSEQLPAKEPILLTDDDQQKIMLKQYEIEKAMVYSSGKETIVLSDSCVLNAGLYMSQERYESVGIQNLFLDVSKNYDLLFFCHPVDIDYLPYDPNRVHDLEAIQAAQVRANDLLGRLKNKSKVEIQELVSTMILEDRYIEANTLLLDKHLRMVQGS